MGCLIRYSQCSQCGNIAADETEACKHIKYFKGNHFYDKDGTKRVVAELCGRAEEPESCVCIDTSWVRKPAFEGAVLRNIVDIGSKDKAVVNDRIREVAETPSTVNDIMFPESTMLMRAASSGNKDVRRNSAKQAAGILLKEMYAADPEPEPPLSDTKTEDKPKDDNRFDTDTEDKADAPIDDTSFPEAPEGDNPPAAEEAGPSLTDSPAPAEEPVIDEPAEDATSKEVKDMFKKQVLNELRRDLLKAEAKKKLESRPTGLENDINESLVHDASVLSSERDVDAYIKRALVKDAGQNDRLRNGLMILANLKDWSQFKRYGYDRSDVLGILCYIDRKTASDPIDLNTVKALSKVKLASNDLRSFFTEIIFETGHKPSTRVASKIISWAKILKSFEDK